jgi:hypothetical protein
MTRLNALLPVSLALLASACGSKLDSAHLKQAEINQVSAAQLANDAFTQIKSLPFGWYGTDACDDRAYLSSIALALKGIPTQHVMLVKGEQNLPLLPPKFKGSVRWRNHIAPVVNGIVVDPATGDAPAHVDAWKIAAGLQPADKKSKTLFVPGSLGFVSGSKLLRNVVQPAIDRGETFPVPKSMADMPKFHYDAASTSFTNVMFELQTDAERKKLCVFAADMLNTLSSQNKLDFSTRYVGESMIPPAWPCAIETDGKRVFPIGNFK